MDKDNLPVLPAGWVWTKLKEITDLSSGIAFKKNEYSPEGIRLLQIANVSFGKIIWDNLMYVPQTYIETYSKLVLKPDDILIALNRPIL